MIWTPPREPDALRAEIERLKAAKHQAVCRYEAGPTDDSVRGLFRLACAGASVQQINLQIAECRKRLDRQEQPQ